MLRLVSLRSIAIACTLIGLAGLAPAGTIHVDQGHRGASDENPGTAQQPLESIGRAAAIVQPGDTVLVHEGIYREAVKLSTSGSDEAPIRFVARPGDAVVVSGTEPIDGPWSVYRGSVYRTQAKGPVRQLFLDGTAMVEARWPNCPPGRLWDMSRWARAGKGSRYGKMVDPKLAATGVDFSGAIAVLNVAHQFYTWTRTVQHHAAGSDTFEYAKDFSGITSYADKTKQWEDDRYYLFGTLAALDSPGEWYYDNDAETLYFWPPDGKVPGSHRVEGKRRDYGFSGRGLANVQIRGFHFFGCAFALDKAEHVAVEACHVLYPSIARHLDEKGFNEDSVFCRIEGRDNVVRNSSFAFGSTSGLNIRGSGNLVENILLHDFCWDGSLKYCGLRISGQKAADNSARNIARYNTLFNLGNAVIGYYGPGETIEYNHVYDGGLCCKDVALVYTGSPSTAGNIVRYNWVHGCRTEESQPGGLQGGLGIRGDDQTRSLTVDHNVVWDCGRDGIIVKGDDNRVVNNTVFDIGTPDKPGNYVNLHTAAEPKKWWRKQAPLLPVQNANSLIANNAALTITCNNKGTPYKFKKNLVGNYQGKDLKLVDPAALDFRPCDDSPLVDAGKVVEGFSESHEGAAPDVGAYEHGRPRWVPGYRNALCVLSGCKAAGAGRQDVQAALAMPPLEALTVAVTAASPGTRVSQSELTFTPDNWMRPQTLSVDGPNARLRFAIPQFELDRTVELSKIGGDDVWSIKQFGFRTVP